MGENGGRGPSGGATFIDKRVGRRPSGSRKEKEEREDRAHAASGEPGSWSHRAKLSAGRWDSGMRLETGGNQDRVGTGSEVSRRKKRKKNTHRCWRKKCSVVEIRFSV